MEQIPIEVLEAARLKTKRRIAAAIIDGLAENGSSIEEVESRLNKDQGFLMNFIQSLIDGSGNSLDRMSDSATALGSELLFGLTPYQQVIDEHKSDEA